LRGDDVMALGGIRSIWNDTGTGQPVGTVSIVTTSANPMMAHIHNNPQAEGPRMPFIVPRELDALWLSHDASSEQIMPLIGPFDEALLEAYTVGPLLGRQASPNSQEALRNFDYPELALL
jgi:putative SOS response-associated peptidase YedK